MGTGRLQPKYQCPECMDLHDGYDSALGCCEPDVSEVWLCPVCGALLLNEEEAIECCGFDPDGPPPPPTAEELEAAGQQNFFNRINQGEAK